MLLRLSTAAVRDVSVGISRVDNQPLAAIEREPRSSNPDAMHVVVETSGAIHAQQTLVTPARGRECRWLRGRLE
jgi:hypothetical protein